ncbi:MAG: hypothetical protein WDA00_01880 [Eubacteriales bacterium]
MKQYLLPANRPFYKANLHAHTTVSDGRLSPEELKRLYRGLGYDILAITDHEVMLDHTHLSEPSFLFLKGYEIGTNPANPTQKTCHIGLLAKRADTDAQICFDPARVWGNARNYLPLVKYRGRICQTDFSPRTVNYILKEAAAHGFFAILNHPFWSRQTEQDYLAYEGFAGLEVYNHLSRQNGTADEGSFVLDRMLAEGKHPLPIAADDNHNEFSADSPYSDAGGGFTMICAPSLSYAEVMGALERGDAYASTGPQITELFVEDGQLVLRCSAVRDIACLTDRRPRWARLCAEGGEGLTGARFPLPDEYAYVRVELTDHAGRRAFSRAYTKNEIDGSDHL